MTSAEKITMVKTLSGETTDATVGVYLSLAENAVLNRLYEAYTALPDGATVPARYEIIQCQLAARYLDRRGAEGEKVHNENGISRTYDSVDDSDLLGRVTPLCEVPQ